MTSTIEPRVWIGTWNDYNAGILHGEWIDCLGLDVETLQEKVNSILASSPTAMKDGIPAEEWSVFDREGFGPFDIGEYSSVSDIVSACEQLEKAEESGLDYEILDAFGQIFGFDYIDRENLVETIQDCYLGHYDKMEDWAAEEIEERGLLKDIPETISYYFDFEAYARDCEYNGDIKSHRANGGFYVFRQPY